MKMVVHLNTREADSRKKIMAKSAMVNLNMSTTFIMLLKKSYSRIVSDGLQNE